MTKMMMMTLMSTTMFMILKHPLSMVMMLIIQSLMIAMITGMESVSYWYSYILFMIMVGGMLVIFIYMTSVASNEKFKMNMKIIMVIPMMMMTVIMTPENYNLNYMSEKSFNSMNKLIELSMNKYINMPMSMTTITLMIYLLITLIAVVKITMIKYGPLRQK